MERVPTVGREKVLTEGPETVLTLAMEEVLTLPMENLLDIHRRDGHVPSTAIATAIGCDADGWRHILGPQPSARSRTAPGKGSSRRCVRGAQKASSWSRAMPMRA